MTRLLKTAIIGIWEKTVASSWIDMLAGLSMLYNFRMPPGFCASAGPVIARAIASRGQQAASTSRRFRLIYVSDPQARSGFFGPADGRYDSTPLFPVSHST